ncbi:MAG: MaoC family dehydratase [Beijerinckiaceae bacterium]
MSALAETSGKARIELADLERRIGGEVGVSQWCTIGQDRIDAFADVTLDHQYIHVDPQAARGSPFGGTIAHGFLSLSMLSHLAMEALPDIEGRVMGVNYGFDRIRFISPVRAGSRIRGRFHLAELIRRSEHEFMMRYRVSVEIEGEDKPAIVADWLTLSMFE